MKKLKLFIILITILSQMVFLGRLSASDETSALTVKIAADFESTLKLKGWNAEATGDSINAWSYKPDYQTLKISVKYQEINNDSFQIIIESESSGKTDRKIFPFNKQEFSTAEKIESHLIPYLISLTNDKVKENSNHGFNSSVKAGYYRTNDNRKIFPDKSEGMFFIGWKLAYDPLKDAGESSLPLYIGDYFNSEFTLSVDREKKKIFGKLDEFNFDIDIILYGKSSRNISGEKSNRNLYGLFTGAEYYRPYLKGTSLLWSDDIYTDHNHIQYCYWETVEYIQDLTLTDHGRSLSLRYEIGVGPGQNSSLTATNVSIEEEKTLNPIFVSNWYGKHDLGDRRHNYYYSITTPVKIEAAADKYLNSKFEFKYHFYYFQSIQDKKAQDFLNRVMFNYGFYVTENITAGFGYEFCHVKSIENEKNKSHYWNRFNIQMDMNI